jgi:hydrophobe/amphiphile efflux-3 (HAE3) family protein
VNRLLGVVTRRPGWVLAVVAALTVLSFSQVVDPRTGELRIGFDPSTNALLPDGDEGRRFYDHVRRLFGSDETILVALVDEDVFTAENLHRIKRMVHRIEGIDGVHHVVSLTNALNIRAENGDLAIEPFVDEVPEDPARLQAIRREALENPIYAGSIVSRDARAAALTVYLMDISEREFLARGIHRQIERIAREESGGAKVWITGPAYVKAEMSRVLLTDLSRTIPLASIVIFLVALFCFRTLAGALIPLVTVGIALIWTLGLVAWLGASLNVITVVLPPLVLVVGFAYAIHVVSEYYEVLRHGEAGADGTVKEALRRVALPVLLAGATTSAGFLSLATSPLGAIRQFGLFTTAGVAATMVVTLTFAPALLQLLPSSRRVRERSGADGFERLARRIAAFDVRRRAPILIAGAVVAVIALVGVSQIRISTDVIRLFDPESTVRRDFEAINEHLEGSDALYVVAMANYRDAFKEPVNLREVEKLQHWLEGQPEIGGTTSLVDYLRLINRGFHDDDPAYLAIPEPKALVAQLLLFGANDELESFVDSRYQTVSILVRSKAIDSGDVTALVRRIETRLESLPDHLEARVTGNSVLINETSDEIALGQAVSLALAFFIIYAMLCLLFMSFRVGALALIPNALPVLVYFGTLGLTGITLNTTTGLVACLVLGIAVDDTIHFLARFNSAARRLADEAEGVSEALWSVGRPVTYTSAALCLGFLTITTSELQNQVQFGALAAFTLGFAWLVDVILTPALAARMRIVTLWDVLTLDLGDDPHRSIPLFSGLTKHQARIVALMTSLRRFPVGQKLFRTGDEGDEMFVVIHGRMTAAVPGKGGIVRVEMGRGDVVGEVGLFHGRRTADVDTVSDVTLLRLTQQNLERLRRRYPRIGAQLYRNLSWVLADRMARSTERTR